MHNTFNLEVGYLQQQKTTASDTSLSAKMKLIKRPLETETETETYSSMHRNTSDKPFFLSRTSKSNLKMMINSIKSKRRRNV